MPAGTCDPSSRGAPYNVLQLAVGDEGDVFVTIRYGWDNVSTRETGCDGPLVNGTGSGNVWAVSYTNAGQTTYYMNTVGRNGRPRTLTLNPGASGTLTRAQANAAGYMTRADCDNLELIRGAVGEG
ncbi:MAG TPA: hypothetical protein VF062_02135 [Candidatus Limnocylindrales bacterium]